MPSLDSLYPGRTSFPVGFPPSQRRPDQHHAPAPTPSEVVGSGRRHTRLANYMSFPEEWPRPQGHDHKAGPFADDRRAFNQPTAPGPGPAFGAPTDRTHTFTPTWFSAHRAALTWGSTPPSKTRLIELFLPDCGPCPRSPSASGRSCQVSTGLASRMGWPWPSGSAPPKGWISWPLMATKTFIPFLSLGFP